MNLWELYDYMVNTVHVFMGQTNHCLYNALVLTIAEHKTTQLSNYPELTIEQLQRIRECCFNLSQMIEQELMERQAEKQEDNE